MTCLVGNGIALCRPNTQNRQLIDWPKGWKKPKHCTCQQIITWTEEWYGTYWIHQKDCKLLNPPLSNLVQFQEVEIIGCTGDL